MDFDCLTCPAGKIKIPIADDLPGKCFAACAVSTMFLDPITLMCKECHPSCLTCIGPNEFDCLICPATLFKNPFGPVFDLLKPGFC